MVLAPQLNFVSYKLNNAIDGQSCRYNICHCKLCRRNFALRKFAVEKFGAQIFCRK